MAKNEWLLNNLDKLDDDQTVEAYKLLGKTIMLPFCGAYGVTAVAFSHLLTPRILKWGWSYKLHLVLRVMVPFTIATYATGVSTYYTQFMYEKFYEDFLAKQKEKPEEENKVS